MLAESLIVAYYTKDLHNNIEIWVKRSMKSTLMEAFEEASQIEKDILILKDNLNSEAETTSSSKKKIEILTRPPQVKGQPETLDLESLQKDFQKLSNQFIDLKRSVEEASSSKGSFKPPFRKPFPPTGQTRPLKVLISKACSTLFKPFLKHMIILLLPLLKVLKT